VSYSIQGFVRKLFAFSGGAGGGAFSTARGTVGGAGAFVAVTGGGAGSSMEITCTPRFGEEEQPVIHETHKAAVRQ
jgi:hypothetical protein